jgi:hypothetical protein
MKLCLCGTAAANGPIVRPSVNMEQRKFLLGHVYMSFTYVLFCCVELTPKVCTDTPLYRTRLYEKTLDLPNTKHEC